ncbi:hypothetical protein A1OE_1113 [Candidatus Endolissoclinum faulkneri L2]|uniref:Uncharacterized protein n=1 Tax=Candidatus Endolissoclinum faulkneri L2 TaxID=1193729 RepID=K7ZD84_9PROT|nr:hypothetical protein A1OE_1113 [Candidatus Endolissoclinum faulkneri L2]
MSNCLQFCCVKQNNTTKLKLSTFNLHTRTNKLHRHFCLKIIKYRS